MLRSESIMLETNNGLKEEELRLLLCLNLFVKSTHISGLNFQHISGLNTNTGLTFVCEIGAWCLCV